MLDQKTPLALLFFMTACGSEEGAPLGDETADSLATEAAPVEVEYSAAERLRICQLSHGFSVGRNPSAIDVRQGNDGHVRLSYTRDDGRSFEYDCRLDRNKLRTRMIDEAGPGSGPGNWSGRGSTITFTIDNGEITFREVFFDGSSDTATFSL